jgi:putative ABC transport system permease protein
MWVFAVLSEMNNSVAIYPPALISVYAPWELIVLRLAALLIADAGALVPAGWAARTRTALALRAE